jgi:hypothetical protein
MGSGLMLAMVGQLVMALSVCAIVGWAIYG